MGADLRKQNNTSVADIYMYLDKKSIKKGGSHGPFKPP